MATPTAHAVCSASASERWLHCTAAPRLEEKIAEETTNYAEEGRLAHEVCETAAKLKFGDITKRKYTTVINKLKKDPLFSDEMITTSTIYADYLYEKSMEYDEKPFTAFEVRSDFGLYVPEGFGTSDCVMVGVRNGERILRIFDYKHGKGVAVSSEENSQMKLYALGVLETYKLVYGDSISKVITAIIQPRLFKDVTEYEITVTDLRAWGESIKPIAQKAYYGFGASYMPGDWCRFCRAKTLCRARSDMYSGFVEIKNECAIPGEENEVGKPLLSDDDVGKVLTSAQGIVEWYRDAPLAYADGILQTYKNWQDFNEWPQVPSAVTVQKLAEKQEDPESKSGVVGAFNRTYNIYDAMDKFLPGVYIETASGSDR